MTIWVYGNRALLASFLGAPQSPRQHRSSIVIDRSCTFFRRSQCPTQSTPPFAICPSERSLTRGTAIHTQVRRALNLAS